MNIWNDGRQSVFGAIVVDSRPWKAAFRFRRFGGGQTPGFRQIRVCCRETVALAMMLETIGETEAAIAVENAVEKLTGTKLKNLSVGKTGCSTSEVGDMAAYFVQA